MFEVTDYSQLPSILVSVLAIFLLLYFSYKKYLFSFFDPLFFFLITQAFSIELGFLFIKESYYLINFLVTQAGFHIGFFICAKKVKNNLKGQVLNLPSVKQQQLSLFVLLSFVFILFFNLLFFLQNGIILLGDNPSAEKVDVYQQGGGMGVVRRINWGIIYLTGFLSMYLFIKRERFIYLLIWLLLVIIIAVSGSKGAIIYFIFGIALFMVYADVQTNKFYPILKRLLFVGIISGILIAFLVILITPFDNKSAILVLINRFLFFADAIFFYYSDASVKHFAYLHATDFFSYEFNSILGFMRLAEYKLPLGFEMVKFSLSDIKNFEPTFGPNIPYYLKGYIYFGYFGGVVYSFLLGAFVAFIRNLLVMQFNSPNATIRGLIFIYLNVGVFSICQDSSLYLNTIFDTLFFAIPFVVLSYIIIFPGTVKRNSVLLHNDA